MSHAMDRRIKKLEASRPRIFLTYALMPEVCKTIEEWNAQVKSQQEGTGHRELLPHNPYSNVRRFRWVMD
jgi:hypothetical protein